jgi:hypothetical protein
MTSPRQRPPRRTYSPNHARATLPARHPAGFAASGAGAPARGQPYGRGKSFRQAVHAPSPPAPPIASRMASPDAEAGRLAADQFDAAAGVESFGADCRRRRENARRRPRPEFRPPGRGGSQCPRASSRDRRTGRRVRHPHLRAPAPRRSHRLFRRVRRRWCVKYARPATRKHGVSKDRCRHDLACGRPSRRARARSSGRGELYRYDSNLGNDVLVAS